MGRKFNPENRGRSLNGWLVIDKPKGRTSANIVAEVKRLTGAIKAGHGGTLDPLADGILPVALGEATKTVAYAMDHEKSYNFTIRWGESRSTDDEEGEVINSSAKRPCASDIEAALPAFTGYIDQVPPAFSAIKVDGQRAYDLARKGRRPRLAPRVVHVKQFRLVRCKTPDSADFEIVCGKGTYVRSVARDMAIDLGTFGFVSDIRRTRVGPFDEKSAILLANLAELGHSAALFKKMLPVETVLDDIPALNLTGPQADRLSNGQKVKVLNIQDGVYCTKSGKCLIALAEAKDGCVKPLRIFHLKQ